MITDLRYIIQLPVPAMSELANELRRLAQAIDQEIATKQRRLATLERAREHRGARRAIIEQIAFDLAQGRPVDLSDEKKRRMINLAQKVAIRIKRDLRNAQAMRLYQLGKSNAQIGQALDLHEKSVARIIHAQLARRAMPPAPG